MALSLDFAFEGFRSIRERPKLILFWGAVSLAGSLLALSLLIGVSGPSLAQMMALAAASGTTPDPQAMVGPLEGALPGMALFAAVNMVTNAILATAAARSALTETDDRFGFLGLGWAEARMVVIHGFMGVMTLVLLMIGSVVGSIGGQAGAVTGMVAAAGVIVSLRLRLSLNGPQSFHRQVIDVFGSFALTRQEVWRLALGYVMALLLAAAVWFLCRQVIETTVTLAFGEIAAPDITSLRAYLTPTNAVIVVFGGAVISPLIAAIVYGAPAAAYRALKPSGPA
ncbi:hypothetical protein [Asticcacaulis sp. AC402]|uniref:hypothetical protein n=1 Tax=Asticcacaulis sp. AC402 TaxID=1282361 RepID=UPI0003C3BD6C|nr:hypothetical protein [Asticcacaulis sp. AC402]ESQ76385.1 hypothetical protein ABAC402_04605 [Asticcacaulis sp. AC402]